MKPSKFPILLSPFELDYDASTLTSMEAELNEPNYYSVRSKRTVDFGKLLLIHKQCDMKEAEGQKYLKKVFIYQTLATIDSPLVPNCHVCYISRDISTQLTTAYLVFEYIGCSLATFLKNKKKVTLSIGFKFLKDAAYLLSRAASKGIHHNAITARAILLNTSSSKGLSFKLLNWNGQSQIEDPKKNPSSSLFSNDPFYRPDSSNHSKPDKNASLTKSDSYALAIVLLELIGASRDFIINLKKRMNGVTGRIPLKASDSIDLVFRKMIQSCLLGKAKYRMTPMQITSHLENSKLNPTHEALLDSISLPRFFESLMNIEQRELEQHSRPNKIPFRWELLGIEQTGGDINSIDENYMSFVHSSKLEQEIESETTQIDIYHDNAGFIFHCNNEHFNLLGNISAVIEDGMHSDWVHNCQRAFSKSFEGVHKAGKIIGQAPQSKVKIIVNSPERKSIAWIDPAEKFVKMRAFLLEQGELEEISKRNIVFLYISKPICSPW